VRPTKTEKAQGPTLKSSDDDGKTKAGTTKESPDNEFRARLADRHGTFLDIEKALQDVKQELGSVPLADFLEADLKATTAPAMLTNPHGHYRKLARRLKRQVETNAVEALLDFADRTRKLVALVDSPHRPKCSHCKDGLLRDGEYCGCKTGLARRDLDAYQSRSKCATGKSGAKA